MRSVIDNLRPMLGDQFHSPPSTSSIMTGISSFHHHPHPHSHLQNHNFNPNHQNHLDHQQSSYGHHFNQINLHNHHHQQQQHQQSLDLSLRNITSNDLIACNHLNSTRSMTPSGSSSSSSGSSTYNHHHNNNPFIQQDSIGLLNLDNHHSDGHDEHQPNHQQQRAIRSYYHHQPQQHQQLSSLMETYHQSLMINMTPVTTTATTTTTSLSPISSSSSSSISPTTTTANYPSLNQKRESVITFSHTQQQQNDQSQQQRLTSSISKLYSNSIHNDDDSNENILSPDDDDNDRTITNKQQNLLTKLSSSASLTTSNKLNGTLLLTKLANIGCKDKLLSSDNDHNDNEQQIIIVNNIPLTIDQIICICQILQRCDLKKLEKFIYNLPNDAICNQNELIIRARAIAAYHSGNFKQVYHLLESNEFPLKYHQELQLLWNNAHYKEHEMKRGHPPGAVEKYRIRKKYQFPRTIWDGEEYVYCFKEKNRRILKEFYLKCNLPTQEDKLKLSNETQLTVVQSKLKVKVNHSFFP